MRLRIDLQSDAMNAQAVFTAMLPEHLLLLGIVVLLGLEIAGRGRRATLALALLSVAAAAAAAAWLALSGYTAEPFAGQFSVSPGPLTMKCMLILVNTLGSAGARSEVTSTWQFFTSKRPRLRISTTS